MKYLYTSLILLVPFFAIQAQVSEQFDSVYQNVAQNIIGTDAEKALKIADSLVKISKTKEETVSAYMLKAQIQRQKGLGSEAIANALVAEDISYQSDMYNWNARICGFLSTQYRENGIPIQGKHYLNKAILISKKIEDKNQSLRFQGNLHQELAYYEMDEKNPEKAIAVLKKGNEFFQKMDLAQNKNYYLAVNAELIGKNYVAVNELDSAKSFYYSGLKLLADSTYELSPLKGFLYNGLGNIYVHEKNYEQAYQYFQEALVISEDSQFMALQLEIYTSLLNYFKLTHDNENYIVYNEKFMELLAKENKKKSDSSNEIVKNYRDGEKRFEKSQGYIIAAALLVIILVIMGSRQIYLWRRKKDFKRFKLILSRVKEKSIEIPEEKEVSEPEFFELKETETSTKTKELLPKETEDKLLKKLIKFEKSVRFLEKSISLPVLAGRFETNTKYLSYVINKHKGKDFSAYINELRIFYIIKKLESDPAYLNYKISYLAEECGFSSHSKFTTTFKSITGISPSTFLSYLEQEKKQELSAIQ